MSGSNAAAAADYPAEWDEVAPDAPSRWQQGQKSAHYSKTCELRDRLRAVMGGKCAKCGALEELEFHHPKGRNWVARQKNRLQRMKLYWRDFMNGNLELLCSGCNKSAGAPNGFWQRSKARKRSR